MKSITHVRLSILFMGFILFSSQSLYSQKSITGTFVENPYQQSEIIQVKEKVSENDVNAFLRRTFKLKNDDQLVLVKTEQDELGFTHKKYEQTYKGIKVEHVAVNVHMKGGLIQSVSGNFKSIPQFNVAPTLTATAGFQKAKAVVKGGSFVWENNANISAPSGELVVFANPFSGQLHMAFKYDIYSLEPLYRANVYVDANSGDVLFENNRIHHTNVAASGTTLYNGNRSFTADQTAPTSFRLRQTTTGNGIETYNANNQWNYNTITDFTSTSATSWPDATSIQAHWASEQTHDFFMNKFGRNSFDNAGSVIESYVHYGVDYVNAFWNGSVMTYGDGDGVSYSPLVSVDIVGHEITHGVTEHTANLIYAREAGALNESFSDIFGEALEKFATGSNDWRMGTDMGIGGSGAIRAMDNPNLFNDPDTYGGTFYIATTCVPAGGGGGNDYCGVHTNSGVQNKWFHLLVIGGSGTNDLGNAYSVTGIGMDKAAAIAYRNLSVYLSPTSGFAQARAGAIQAAIDLYGAGSAEEIATAAAWYAVGVGASPCPANAICLNYSGGNIPSTYGTPTASTLSTCPGTITVNVPAGREISSVDVTYSFIADPTLSAWMSEQRSKIYCPTNTSGESGYTSGVGNTPSYLPYSRTGLNFANGLTGSVDFELHLFNTYGAGACTDAYQYVDSSSYSIVVHTVASAVTNDNCANATLLNVGSSCVLGSYTNLNATSQAGIAPNPSCGFYQGADVWFKFTMPASGRVRIEKQNGSTNIQMALYSGVCGTMTELTCMQLDDERTYHNIALAGQTVYLRAYSYNTTNGGTFNLCVWEPPLAPNDYCDNAIALSAGSSCNLQSYTNQYATKDTTYSPPNPSCGFYKGGDVWFTVQMPASGRLRIEKANGSANIQMALYSGTCGSMTELMCMQLDDARTYHNKYLAGQTLYLRAYSYNSEEGGTFQVCAWEPPLALGDYCDSPIPLAVGSACVPTTYDSRYATNDTVYSLPNPSCGFYKGGDVWFSLIMPSSGVLTITRSNISGNLQMALYSGTCGSFTQLTCAQLQATINYTNVGLAGQTLYLRGFGYNSEEGAEFTLCAWDPTCLTTITNVQTTDASCSNLSDGSITITANCANCSGSLEYSIDNGATYQASNVFNNVAPGIYTIKVRDSGDPSCMTTQTNVIVGNSGTPVTYYQDSDNDTYGNLAVSMISCAGIPTGYVLNNTDCNDNNINVWQDSTLYVDADGDGYDAGTAVLCIGNTAPSGYKFTTLGSDCDDNNAGAWLGQTWYLDVDMDGFYVNSQYACGSPGSGWNTNGGTFGDCNDNDITVWQDSTLYVDADGDGYDAGTAVLCIGNTAPSGYKFTTLGSDCDDNNPGAWLGQTWYLDVDMDGFYVNSQYACGSPGSGWNTNGGTFGDCNDNDITVWQDSTLYVDADGDGYDAGTAVLCIGNTAPSGYKFTTLGADCDDNNLNVWQGETWYLDADADGWYVSSQYACGSPGAGWTNVLPAGGSGDCDDSDFNIHAPVLYYVDADGDGYGSTTTAMLCSLTAPSGYATNSTDCDDNNANINTPIMYYVDADGDGYGSTATAMLCSLTPPSGYSTNSTDCDDNNPNINAPIMYYVDADGDGYGSSTTAMLCAAPAPSGYASISGDCDDNNSAVNPGALEICGNGIDDDCVGGDLPCGGGSPCLASNVFQVSNLPALYVNAGANDPYTYYAGLSKGKPIKANVSGGVGPFSYVWSNSGGYTMFQSANGNKASLYYPNAATWVKVSITDIGANCTFEDSVYINFVDFTCNPPGRTWFYALCKNGTTTVCVKGTSQMEDSLRTGNYTLGPCTPKADDLLVENNFNMHVFPNPTNGQFTLLVGNVKGETYVELFDVNAKRVFAENISPNSGAIEKTFDASTLPAGVYFLQVSDSQHVGNEKIVIRH